ncbi:MAG: GFA family protein [Sneathiella sp.]
MSETKTVTARGRCLCGGVAFEVSSARDVIYCHCKQCRSWHGHYIGYSACLKEDLTFLSDRTLKWFSSSGEARRGFCGECGSSLFWQANHSPNINFVAGCLDEPTGLKSESHIFLGSAGDYYELTDTLPKYEESD